MVQLVDPPEDKIISSVEAADLLGTYPGRLPYLVERRIRPLELFLIDEKGKRWYLLSDVKKFKASGGVNLTDEEYSQSMRNKRNRRRPRATIMQIRNIVSDPSTHVKTYYQILVAACLTAALVLTVVSYLKG